MACFERVQEAFKNVLTDVIKEQFIRFGNLKAVIA